MLVNVLGVVGVDGMFRAVGMLRLAAHVVMAVMVMAMLAVMQPQLMRARRLDVRAPWNKAQKAGPDSR